MEDSGTGMLPETQSELTVTAAGASVEPSTRSVATGAEKARFAELSSRAPASFGALFLRRVAASPNGEAYRRHDGAGNWTSQTWAETGTTVTEIAAGLLALGLQAEDRVAIASATRVDWIEADLAIGVAGGATTAIYPTSTLEDVAHILSDSGSRFAFAENASQLAKLLAGESSLERVVLFDDEPPADDRVLSLDALRQRGRELLAQDADAVTRAVDAVTPDQLATLIYTSGTTGRPKGVRIAHSSWVYQGLCSQAIDLTNSDDLGYLWLPLSHSFGKTLLATQLAVGHAAAVDGAVDRIITNLPVVRPTTMAAAPRIFEKVYAGVLANVRAEGGNKLKVFEWAVGVGREVSRLRQQGKKPGALLTAKHRVADKLVLSKVRDRFGGRLRLFISGAAPLSRDIAEFFDAVGLLVLEGYGLTETSAGTFVNRQHHYEFGTVGLPMPGSDVAIADDGEILVRGPGVMQGYHNLPDATAEVLRDGWLATGDVGEITAGGNLKITDRKKDLIKTSGGKYVAPQSLETKFKAICPLASQIVVHGEGRKFVSALIALDAQAVQVWAASNGFEGKSHAEIAKSPQMQATMEHFVAQLNSGLGQWETVKKFEILDRDLTVEDGDLTPSLKLKRRAVERRYAEQLDAFYKD